MIYESVDASEEIKQGDIFFPLPKATLQGLYKIPIIDEKNDGLKIENFADIESDSFVACTPVEKVWAIVASQDCDASRSPFITFFVIGKFEDITGITPPSKPSKWKDVITKKSRLNAKWFYLPRSEKMGLNERMAVDFLDVFQLPREDLLKHISFLRKGRLNKVAYEHYREKISEFYRRYPYDEWYPLTKEEYEQYAGSNNGVEAFDWQK